MKKVLLALGAVCLVSLSSCKEDAVAKIDESKIVAAAERDAKASKFPEITFDRTEHNFGEILSGTPVETVFNYTNTGDAPLVITDVKSSCGCTIPKDWSKTPLAPGESGKFTVKFNGKGANLVSKTVTVTANTEQGRSAVKISAFIKADPNAAKVTPTNAVKSVYN